VVSVLFLSRHLRQKPFYRFYRQIVNVAEWQLSDLLVEVFEIASPGICRSRLAWIPLSGLYRLEPCLCLLVKWQSLSLRACNYVESCY
jgi:hypothetical protein